MRNLLRNILFIIFCATIFKIWAEALEKYGHRSRLNLAYIDMPAYVQKMPGRGNNYRTTGLSASQLDSLLQIGLIRIVIHLGAETPRLKKTRAICEAYNVEFVCLQPGSPEAKESLRWRLIKGQALVHGLANKRQQ